jgi:hypothetical protein
MNSGQELLERIETLQNIMLACATGAGDDDRAYRELRNELVEVPAIKDALPRLVPTCRDLAQFWQFIKAKQDPRGYAAFRGVSGAPVIP